MRKIDKDGLILCDIQGRLFEESVDNENCSSEIFIRRFMNSDISKTFDSTNVLDDTYSLIDIYDSINKQYGKTEYGKIKYNKEELFWIGYIYRYFSYTYNLSSKRVYNIIKPKELREIYLPYHTMDCAYAIERILEYKNISVDEESMMKRALEIYRRLLKEKNNNK